MSKRIKVVELFAGVGGFRLGLEGLNAKKNKKYEIVWSNQWEPKTKIQHASNIYIKRFGVNNHSNEDINVVIERNVEEIPNHDLLVGGFPCQDFSVATTLKNSNGLDGNKGKLWWAIHNILKKKKERPNYLFLENVNRLLISPASHRGRDFAIILQSLEKLGYAVEWRVINAANYGMPQRRRRVFIMAYHKNSTIYKKIQESNKGEWLFKKSPIAKAFPIRQNEVNELIEKRLNKIILECKKENKNGSPFLNTGFLFEKKIYTVKTFPKYNGEKQILKDILQNKGKISDEFIVNDKKDIDRWRKAKMAKSLIRMTKSGHSYKYSEGKMPFPDSINKPSRTITTGEGGKSPSRSKHIIKVNGTYRRLTPLELERLNRFPDNHTKVDEISNTRRAFLMGNALVVTIVEKIGKELYKQIRS